MGKTDTLVRPAVRTSSAQGRELQLKGIESKVVRLLTRLHNNHVPPTARSSIEAKIIILEDERDKVIKAITKHGRRG